MEHKNQQESVGFRRDANASAQIVGVAIGIAIGLAVLIGVILDSVAAAESNASLDPSVKGLIAIIPLGIAAGILASRLLQTWSLANGPPNNARATQYTSALRASWQNCACA